MKKQKTRGGGAGPVPTLQRHRKGKQVFPNFTSLSLCISKKIKGSRRVCTRMAAVGVLALQGSFNEHIAGTFSLHKPSFVSVFGCLFSYSKTSLCVLTALARLGVKGMEIRKPEQLLNVNSLIIPGGESTTMAKLAEFHNLVSTRFFFFLFFLLIYLLII